MALARDGVDVEVQAPPRFLRADMSTSPPTLALRAAFCTFCTDFTMACRRPSIRSLHPSAPSQRSFATTSSRHRLGAATYAQEWNIGTYHYNKSTSKLVPFAHKQTDQLLQQYITQQKKGAGEYANKAAIASHRRKYEKVYLSGSRVKDFGERVEVEAYVFDAAAAKAREEQARGVGGAAGQRQGHAQGQGQREQGRGAQGGAQNAGGKGGAR